MLCLMKNFKFQADWFTPQIPIWKKHLSEFMGKPNLSFLEIGSFEGRSAIWLLENILTHPTSKITCIDTFTGSSEHKDSSIDLSKIEKNFDYNISVSGFGNKVVKIKGKSNKILRQLNFKSYDFIYIDGSHKAGDVLEDSVLSFQLLKNRGIIAFDDYEWDVNLPEIEKPKMAIDAFLKIYEGRFELLFKGIQVIIRKK